MEKLVTAGKDCLYYTSSTWAHESKMAGGVELTDFELSSCIRADTRWSDCRASTYLRKYLESAHYSF